MILRVGGRGREELAGGRGNPAGGRSQGITLSNGAQHPAECQEHVGWSEKCPPTETCPSGDLRCKPGIHHTMWDQSPLLGWDTMADFTDSDNRENQAMIIFQRYTKSKGHT